MNQFFKISFAQASDMIILKRLFGSSLNGFGIVFQSKNSFHYKVQPARHLSTSFFCLNKNLPAPSFDISDNLSPKIATTSKTKSEMFHDFKYTLVPTIDRGLVLERFKDVPDNSRPLVLLFGWAGATQKNLSKYSEVYHKAGCLTLGYNLPSRFVFTETSEIPHLTNELVKILENAKLLQRPIFLHLMSDTGLMVFQGLDIVLKDQNKKINIVGAVLDSCPGPRPKVSIPRILAVGIVNWICCTKDGLGFIGTLKETNRFVILRVIPSIFRLLKGLPVELSLMNDTWSGDHYKNTKDKNWPELFLYSKTDFYLPWKFLEDEILKPRRELGRDVSAVCWPKSPHVSHLRAHRSEYEAAIFNFLHEKYYKTILK